MMLLNHCRKTSQKKEKVIQKLVDSTLEDKLYVIESIFNIDRINPTIPQSYPPFDANAFVKRELYSEDTVDLLLEFLIEFL